MPGSPVRWRENGQRKEVYVYALQARAREALCALEVPVDWQVGAQGEPMPAAALRSLRVFIEALPDFRKRRGQRYSMACYLTIMMAGRLAGYRGVTAFGEFAARLNDDQLKAVGAFWSPSRQRYTAPAASSFHYILSALAPDTLDHALREWVAQYGKPGTPVALDGKDVRGASKQIEGERRMMVAAVEHTSGLVLGQVQVGSKTNEISAVRDLSQELDLAGRVVTLDALHAQQKTTHCLVRNHWQIENRRHYVRDFTYDEDRCRARVRHMPRNLACLSNAAISIVRLTGAFRYLPEANRHYAARPQDALDAVLTATEP